MTAHDHSQGDDHPITQYIPATTWSLIKPHYSPKALTLLSTLLSFLQSHILPSEHLYHSQIPLDPAQRWKVIPPVMEELKVEARKRGLWNLFLGKAYGDLGAGLTNLEYAVMAEITGYAPHIFPQAINCAAPDTGNMEVFAKYASPSQKSLYLTPLLEGKIRSSFAMTEFGVSSSDATNVRTEIRREEGGGVVVSGRKWWISGAGDPRNGIHILIGLSDPQNPSPHKRHTIVLIPPNTPGVTVVRPLTVFGYDDAPEGHCEVLYEEVRLGEECIVGGWGRGFEIIQGRLGPGRIHHCMRSIGTAQRALDMMLERVSDPKRKTFGKQLKDHGTILSDIAKSRAEIDQARLLVLSAAHQIDISGAKGALKDIGLAKFTVPSMALRVVDRAMQAFGAEGISQDQPLASFWAGLRTLRYADGPDEVHQMQIGKVELKRVGMLNERSRKVKERMAVLEEKAGGEAKVKAKAKL